MPTKNKFGAFAGVYTPSVLTILGVIMYMRLGWVIGEAGIYTALAIILIAHIISITTGLSISSIATDKKIKSGGIYYLLSRSLGFPMGGAIGITLFVGTALSIALYIVGFSESFLGIQSIADFLGMHQDVNSYRILGSGVLILLVILAFISTSLALKSQYFILGAIGLSLVSIIVGIFTGDSATATEINYNPARDHVPFITIFAIFFPAVTGFTAGVAMSGDLEDPKKAIPKGTLWAIATGLIVYIGLALIFGFFIDRDLLINDNNFLMKIAWYAPLVVAGIWGATLSSALGGILGGPRILQAIALDKIIPKFLGKGYGASNEPRNALIFTFLLAEVGILIGELDAIAEVVSMFYIAAYGFINLAFALEHWASTDFRPTFKVSRWFGILGFIASFAVMFQLNPGAMFAAFVIMWLIYFILKRKEIKSESGDVWSSVWTSVARTSLTKLQEKQIEERNWKPNIILFNGEGDQRKHLIQIGKSFIGKFGFLSIFDLVLKKNNTLLFTKKEQRIETGENGGAAIFQRKHSVNDIYDGIVQISSTYGFSGVEPNTVLLGYGRNTENPEKFGKLIRNIYKLDLNILMLDYDKERKFGEKKRIDIWWRGAGQNGNLALQLVKFLWTQDEWQNSKLRLLIVNPDNNEHDSIFKKAHNIVTSLRIDANIKIINNEIEKRSFYEIVQTESVNTDLIFMGIPDIAEGEEKEFIETTNYLCKNIGSVVLVKASSFFKALQIGSSFKKENTVSEIKSIDIKETEEVILAKHPEVNIFIDKLFKSFESQFANHNQEYIQNLCQDKNNLQAKLDTHIQKLKLNLKFASDNTSQDAYVSRMAIIESKLLDDISKDLEAFKAILNEDNSFKKSTEAFIKQALYHAERWFKHIPKSLNIKLLKDDLIANNADAYEMFSFKAKRRFLQKLGLGKNYTLHSNALYRYVLADKFQLQLQNTLNEVAKIYYTYLVEIQKFIQKIDRSFQELKLDESKDKAIIFNQLIEELDEIKIKSDSLDGLIVKIIKAFPIKVKNSFIELLDQTHANRNIQTDFNTIRRFKMLTKRSRRLPDIMLNNGVLLTNNLILNNSILIVKNRLLADKEQLKIKINKIIQKELLNNRKEFIHRFEKIIESFDERSETKSIDIAEFNFESKHKSSMAHQLLGRSQKRIELWKNVFPEKLELLDNESSNAIINNPFEPINTFQISVYQLIEYLTDNEFIEPIRGIIETIPRQIQAENTQLKDQLRLINYTLDLTQGKELIEGKTKKEYLEAQLNQFNKEIDKLHAYEQNIIFKIEEQSSQVLSQLSLYPFLKMAQNLKQYIKEKREEDRKNVIVQTWKKGVDFTKTQFANIIFGQSSGILFTKSLLNNYESKSMRQGFMDIYRSNHIANSVFQKIPFYYKHMFLKHHNFSLDFMIGRKAEMKLMAQQLENRANNFFGNYLISGERHSGRSYLANAFAEINFDKEKIFIVNPPPGGSTAFEDFENALQLAFDSTAKVENILNQCSKDTVIIIEDIELWWSRIYKGDQCLRHILNLMNTYKNKIIFMAIINSHALGVLEKMINLNTYFSTNITSNPMNSREIADIILLRHRISNLKFEINGQAEENFKTWSYAKLFNKFFNYTGGNAGYALRTWVNQISSIEDNTIVLSPPKSFDINIFDHLNQQELLLISLLAIHHSSNFNKLMDSSKMTEKQLNEMIENLKSYGLVTQNSEDVYKIDPITYHPLVKYLQTQKLL